MKLLLMGFGSRRGDHHLAHGLPVTDGVLQPLRSLSDGSGEVRRRSSPVRVRQAHARRGAVRSPPRLSAIGKDRLARLWNALQKGEGAIAGDLTERATRRVTRAFAGRLNVTERAIRGGAQAVLQSGLGGGIVRHTDNRRRRQQDLQSERQSKQHYRDRVASHPAYLVLAKIWGKFLDEIDISAAAALLTRPELHLAVERHVTRRFPVGRR